VRGHGTMKGDFQGMKANGKKAEWEEMHIARFNAAGKMAEHWATVDQLAMLTQLGFAPGQ
jgi:predicted ester cyclase